MRTTKQIWDEVTPGDYVVGWVTECEACGVWLIGAKDTRFCSDRCRMRLTRNQDRPAEPRPQSVETLSDAISRKTGPG